MPAVPLRTVKQASGNAADYGAPLLVEEGAVIRLISMRWEANFFDSRLSKEEFGLGKEGACGGTLCRCRLPRRPAVKNCGAADWQIPRRKLG
jgi:hypothetical protein